MISNQSEEVSDLLNYPITTLTIYRCGPSEKSTITLQLVCGAQNNPPKRSQSPTANQWHGLKGILSMSLCGRKEILRMGDLECGGGKEGPCSSRKIKSQRRR